jgi:hypothetical protein
MSTLHALDENLWTVAVPHKFMAFHFGARMNVVRLPSGALWLHSPVPLSPQLGEELDALGPVRHVVAPNLFHHLYAGQYADAWPESRVHVAPGLAQKRADLRIDTELSEASAEDWEEQIDALPVGGSPRLRETVFLHRSSKTLITCDMAVNLQDSDHWLTRQYLRWTGTYKRTDQSRALRMAFPDRKAARASIDRILRWDFDRLLVAHGEVVETGAKEIFRHCYRWL